MASRRSVALLCGVLGLGGCATVPSSGPVHVVAQVSPGPQNAPDVQIIAEPPVPGEAPVDIVAGFLAAMANAQSGHAIARQYLAPTAAVRWADQARVDIYELDALRILPSAGHTVTVSAPLLATVDSAGSYRPATGELTENLPLTRVSGQWRLAAVPPGILLAKDDFALTFRPVTVYFLADRDQVVVPEPLFLQARLEGLPSAVVNAVLAGPPPAAAASVTSAVPKGTRLVDSVTVASGVADVNLSAPVLSLSAARARALVTQIVLSLCQLRGVDAVRLSGQGTPLVVPGLAQPYAPASLRLPPDDLGPAPPVYYVSGGKVRRLGPRAVTPVPGTDGVYAPAASADGAYLAGLRSNGSETALVLGGYGAPLRTVIADPQVLAPSFDAADDAWSVVTTGAGGQLVVRVSPQGAVTTVPAPALSDVGPVTAFAVSRDGTRIALVAGGRLFVGPVTQTAAGPALVALQPVLPATDRAEPVVTWVDGLTLATLLSPALPGVGAEPAQLYSVRVDGWWASLQPVGAATLPVPPTEITAAPGQPMLVTAGGALWEAVAGQWSRVTSGGDPAYPGG